MNKLNDFLQMLNQENKTMFVTGDFNINTSDAIINPNINVNNFQNIFLSYLYTPLIDKYTTVDKKRGTSTLLDNIYSNVTQIHSGLFKTDYSDHYSIFCVTDFVIRTRNIKFKIKRDFSQKISQTLKKLLINITGNRYCLIAVKLHFQNIFSECFMNNFPTKTLKSSTTTGYHISQVDSKNQSNINIPLDMLMPKIQLMKINRNVEHSITN